MDYWAGRNLGAVADALTTDEVRRAEKNAFIDIRMGKQGGIGHIAPDIEGVISRGLNAFIEAAENHMNHLDLTDPGDYAKLPFLKAAVIADRAVIKWAGRFADLAREKAAVEQNGERKGELEQIADTCDRVPAEPARNFREALQVVAFIMASVQIESNGVSIGTGRLDQYCFPYYEKDLKERRGDLERPGAGASGMPVAQGGGVESRCPRSPHLCPQRLPLLDSSTHRRADRGRVRCYKRTVLSPAGCVQQYAASRAGCIGEDTQKNHGQIPDEVLRGD